LVSNMRVGIWQQISQIERLEETRTLGKKKAVGVKLRDAGQYNEGGLTKERRGGAHLWYFSPAAREIEKKKLRGSGETGNAVKKNPDGTEGDDTWGKLLDNKKGTLTRRG